MKIKTACALSAVWPLITFASNPAFNQSTIPTAQVGTAYSVAVTVSGGRQPYTFAITAGSLPSGSPAFSLSPNGLLTGTPNGCPGFPNKNCAKVEPMTSTFTVTATDSMGAKIPKTFTLGVYWNPTRDQYISGFQSAMQAIQADVAGLPVPRIQIAGQHWPSNVNEVGKGRGVCDPAAAYGSPNACEFDNLTVMNAYTDAQIRMGATGIDANPDALVFAALPEYTGALPNDCPNGWWCKTAANYDGMFQYAAAHGLTIKLRPVPGSAVSACGFNVTSTESDLENCYKPLFVAAASHWRSVLTKFTPVHEAGSAGAWGNPFPMTLTVPMMDQFLGNVATSIKQASPGLLVGAASITMDPTDVPLFEDYVTIPSFDYVEIDLFMSACDVTAYPTTAWALAKSWAALGRSNGKLVDIGETARPAWVPANCAKASEANAIESAGDTDWDGATGADAVFYQTMIPALAAAGFDYFSDFNTGNCIWYSADHSNTRISSQYPSQLMLHLGETTGTGYAFLQLTQQWGM